MKTRLLLAALVLVGAAGCHSISAPEPPAREPLRPGEPVTVVSVPSDSTRTDGGSGMGSGN